MKKIVQDFKNKTLATMGIPFLQWPLITNEKALYK
jgi:hypothetical protein